MSIGKEINLEPLAGLEPVNSDLEGRRVTINTIEAQIGRGLSE